MSRRRPARPRREGLKKPAVHNPALYAGNITHQQIPQQEHQTQPAYRPPSPCSAKPQVWEVPDEYMNTTLQVWPQNPTCCETLSCYSSVQAQPFYEGPNAIDIPQCHLPQGSLVNVRCSQCRTYMNPYNKFVNGTKAWMCCMCKQVNQTPKELYKDGILEHAVLEHPIIDIFAEDLLENAVRHGEPMFCFAVCTTEKCVNTGVFKAVIDNLIEYFLSWDPPQGTRMFFVTIGDCPQIYSFTDDSEEPTIHVIHGRFVVPEPQDRLFFDFHDYKDRLLNLLENIDRFITMDQTQYSTFDNIVGGCANLLHPYGGKIILFHYGLPAGFKTNQERSSFSSATNDNKPTNPFFGVGRILNRFRCVLDLYQFSKEFCDLRSLEKVQQFTGGKIYYYRNFDEYQVNRFRQEFLHAQSKTIYHNTEYVLRTSIFYRNERQFSHSPFGEEPHKCSQHICPSDHSICFILDKRPDQEYNNEDFLYFQFAIAFWEFGSLKVRVITIERPTSKFSAEIIENVSAAALGKLIVMQALEAMNRYTLIVSQRCVQDCAVEILREYIKPKSNWIARECDLPPNLIDFPMFVLGCLKSNVFGGLKDPDLRMSIVLSLFQQPDHLFLKYFLPNFYIISEMSYDTQIGTIDSETDYLIYPPQNPLSYYSLSSECTYLLDNGIDMFLWIGQNTPSEFLQEIFGTDNLENDLYEESILDRSTNASNLDSTIQRFWAIIDSCIDESCHKFNEIRVIIQGTNNDPLQPFMYEDRTKKMLSKSEFFDYLRQQTMAKGDEVSENGKIFR